MLKHNPKVSGLTERAFAQLNMYGINRKLNKRCCRADLGSVWDLLIR